MKTSWRLKDIRWSSQTTKIEQPYTRIEQKIHFYLNREAQRSANKANQGIRKTYEPNQLRRQIKFGHENNRKLSRVGTNMIIERYPHRANQETSTRQTNSIHNRAWENTLETISKWKLSEWVGSNLCSTALAAYSCTAGLVLLMSRHGSKASIASECDEEGSGRTGRSKKIQNRIVDMVWNRL